MIEKLITRALVGLRKSYLKILNLTLKSLFVSRTKALMELMD